MKTKTTNSNLVHTVQISTWYGKGRRFLYKSKYKNLAILVINTFARLYRLIKYSVKSLKFMDSNIRVLSKKNFIFVDVQIRWSPCCSQYAHILWQIFVDFFISRFDGVDGVMVFNATFNNISVVSWRSVSLVEKT